jgi:hypothetical protein
LIHTLRSAAGIPREIGARLDPKDLESMIDLLIVLPNSYQIKALQDMLQSLGKSRKRSPKMPDSCVSLLAKQIRKKSSYPLSEKSENSEQLKLSLAETKEVEELLQPFEQQLDQIESGCAAMDMFNVPVHEFDGSQGCVVSYRLGNLRRRAQIHTKDARF